MSAARIRTLLLALLALTIACGSLAGSAQAAGSEAEGEWRMEQPARPPAPVGLEEEEIAKVPVGLGRIGDIAFWSPNRGALITAGNGSIIAPGGWVYNGACEAGQCAGGWHQLATVCGASDGRILHAKISNDGFFRPGAAAGRAWTWGCTCQVSREASAGSGSD